MRLTLSLRLFTNQEVTYKRKGKLEVRREYNAQQEPCFIFASLHSQLYKLICNQLVINFKHLLDCPENRDAKSKSYGHRAFGFAGADMWNTLPLDIKLSSSVSVFKSKLKTHLFKQCYGLTN